MSGQPSTTDFKKLILDKCDAYTAYIKKSPFSVELQSNLIKIVSKIRDVCNSDFDSNHKQAVQQINKQFIIMNESIQHNEDLYGVNAIVRSQAIAFQADVESALDRRSGDLNTRAVLQKPQQIRDTTGEENQQLRSKIQQLEKELRESQEQLTYLQKTPRQNIERLTAELLAANDGNIWLNIQLKEAKDRASAAQQQAIDSQQKVASQEVRLQQVGNENQRLQAELEKSRQREREQLSGASTREKEFNAALAAKDVYLESLKVRALTAEGKVAAADEKASQAESGSLKLKEQIAQLQQELGLQKQTLLTEGVASNAALQSQIGSLNEQLEQKRAELRAQGESLASATTQNQQLLGENSRLRKSNEQLVSDNERLSKQLGEAQSQSLASQRALKDGLGSQDENVKSLQAQLREAEVRAAAAGKQTAGLTEQLNSQTVENNKLSASNTQLLSENETLKQRLEEAQSQSLASRQALQDGLGSQDEIFKKLKDQLTEAADSRDKAAGKQIAELMKQLNSQKDELTQVRGENETLKQNLEELESRLAEQGTDLLAKANLLAAKGEELQALQDRSRVEEQQLTTIEQQRKEIEQLTAKVEELIEAQGVSAIDKKALERLTAENERLKIQSTESGTKQEQQESQIQALLNQDEQNRNTVKSLHKDKEVLILQRDRLKEKIAELRQQKEQTTPDRQDSASKHNIPPAIGLIEGARSPVDGATAKLGDNNHTLVQPEDPSSLSPLKKFTEEFTSGSMLEHKYAEDDTGTKVESSSYDLKNTENKFKNDGGEEVAALLADSKTIVLEGEPPQKMRYTKDLDKDPTILAGALTLEGISESQPKGGHSVQATMEDCDDHPEFILDVLIKFHERLNENLKKKSTEELENVHCTTIDYKGDNLMIRNIIDSHNKAAKQINSGELTTKKFQSNQMVEQLRNQKAIAPQALPADLKRRVSDQEQNRSRLLSR